MISANTPYGAQLSRRILRKRLKQADKASRLESLKNEAKGHRLLASIRLLNPHERTRYRQQLERALAPSEFESWLNHLKKNGIAI